MFAAIYGVIFLLIRYLFSSTDSIIYYFLPLPIAIYTYWKKSRDGLMVLLVTLILSFLTLDIYRVLLLILPNLLIGYVMGLLQIYFRKNVVIIFIVFILALLADYLSIYAFEVVTGVDYLESLLLEFSFAVMNKDLLANILLIALPIVLVLDSLIKVLLLEILFVLLTKRLNIENNFSFNFPLVFKPLFSLIAVLLNLIAVLILASNGYEKFFLLKLSLIIILSLSAILALYMIMSFLIFVINYYFANKKKLLRLLIIVLGIIFFPITYLASLIFNLIFYKFIK